MRADLRGNPQPPRAARVVVLYKSLPAYRGTFFEALRVALAASGVELVLVHGDSTMTDRMRGDDTRLPWAILRANRTLEVRSRTLVWQPVLRDAWGADLVIVEQASKLVVNYVLLALDMMRVGPPIALWGHGANLNPRTRSRSSEWMKRRYSRRAHWWFAYTPGSKQRVVALGYPQARISVVQNASDTELLQSEIQALSPQAVAAYRLQHACTPGATALFIGSLYTDKRVPFLIEAAVLIHRANPDFVLLIAGDGPERRHAIQAADRYPFIRFLGRIDGADRALALAVADCVLMPGLVGLAILDAFAASAPMVTTDVNSHSPEIEYLTDGHNGLMLSGSPTAADYAKAVHELLGDSVRLSELQEGCRAAAARYTNAEFVSRFRDGVLDALAAG